MNHDIAHCNNEDCSIKNRCHRYLAHLDAELHQLPYVSYFIIDKSMFNEDGSCKEFWDDEAFRERLNRLRKQRLSNLNKLAIKDHKL